MNMFETRLKSTEIILALGAESAGNFSVFKNGRIHFSQDFGDLLDDANFSKFKKAVLKFLNDNKIKPKVVLTDLHPDYRTTTLGREFSEKFKTKHIQVQHHIAHIFSQLGNFSIHNTSHIIPDTFFGVALDGTGYGTDGKIWGGEVFKITKQQKTKTKQIPNSNSPAGEQIPKFEIKRIGKLENQTMLGGELAVSQPARMLLTILARIKNCESKIKNKKEFIYNFVKKYYDKNQFELLYNQLQQNFNCQETSSAGRVLDAVSVLLGFAKNKRNYKHEATYLLEKNSTKPYADLRPKIEKIKNYESRIMNQENSNQLLVTDYELLVTPLFEYLIKNLHKDKKRLAATAQLYIAQGLDEIVRKNQESGIRNQEGKTKLRITPYELPIILSGGISNNKIISDYFENRDKKKPSISLETPGIPRGDAGLSFGQIVYFILNNTQKTH